MDEDFRLSAILACLQIQAIYRESTGNRLFRFFGSASAAARARSGDAKASAGPALPASGAVLVNETLPRPQRRRSSHKSETRISAIADLAGNGKREKKALRLSLRGALAARGRAGQ
jgi:hypothetical protein